MFRPANTIAVVILVVAAVPVSPAFSQIDRQEQVGSLEDAGQFRLVVDVEAGRELTADSALDVSRLRSRLADRIEAVSSRRPFTDPNQSDLPHLYVHVNAHDAGGGLVPFSVNAYFIQEVRLSEGGRRMMAITWESGFVGVVSYDRLVAIPDAAESLVEEFAGDLVAAGGGS